MIETIRETAGMIIIFVSHNMGDVAELSDRVMVMNHGRIAMTGTPREVFSREEELEAMGLNVPPVRDIMRQIGRELPGFTSIALTLDEAAEDISRYLAK